jgi:NitT/TauT family transport system permease protein
MNKRFLKYILSSIFGLALLVGLWSLIAYTANIPTFILPKPTEVWNAFIKEHSLLYVASYNTGMHALIGFLAAAFFGFIIAWVFSVSPRLYPIIYPWLLILQLTPIIIITPILILWFGHNSMSIAVVAFMICFFPIVISTTTGLRSTPHSMHELFGMMNASRMQTFLHLKLPQTLPYYLSGLRVAATLAPIGAITGDIFLGSSAHGQMGLGYLVTTYYSQLKIPALFATALLSCVLGFAFVFCVYLLDWYALHKWHESYQKNQ